VTALGDFLKAEGFTVNDSNVPYGREATWDKVRWLFVHHTAGSETKDSEDGQASYIRTAEGRYPPLAQLMLGQSSKVWVCAKPRSGQKDPGRASHAGEGSYPGISKDSANEVSLGVEVHCDGSHALSTHKAQYETLIDLLASLCSRYGLTSKEVVGHKEYSSTGKIDPRDDMDTIRRDVKDRMASGDNDGDAEMLATVRLKTSTDQSIPAAPSWNNIDWDSENDPQGWHADPGGYPSISCRKTGWVQTYARVNPKGGGLGDTLTVEVIRNVEPGDDSAWETVDSMSWVTNGSKRYSWSPSFRCVEGHKYRLRIQGGVTASTLDYGIWAWLVFKAPA